MDGARDAAPSILTGALVAAALVAATTIVLYPLEDIAPVATLGVVYLLAVIVVATFWPVWLAVVTTVASAAAFNFFHLPPTGRFTLAERNHWLSLAAFVVVGLATCSVAAVARRRAVEAEMRREEADLAAEAARLLLGERDLEDALKLVAERVATGLGLPSAAIAPAGQDPGPNRQALALGAGAELVVPAELTPAVAGRLAERIVPALEPVVAAALERESLQAEVVETAALRQSDVAKTAVLRAVSHDLRSPLTAMVTAGEALRSPALEAAERDELASVVVDEGSRLSRLIEKLLDLSRLQSGTGTRRPELVEVEDLLREAAHAAGGADRFELSLGALPPVRADAAQLERAFANLLENAARHSGGHPVIVRARAQRDRLVIRVVDRGPGIPRAEQERIFEPFYRGGGGGGGRGGGRDAGAGLGLAIVRGLVEANGGRVWVESLPGQGSSFVVALPIERAEALAR
ncbi:sensor histidine kinase [Capillimicrobium parvum]|uniref:histidine kinase n=1 Tax=Capillimicrobium parvum TaxID=2884022 RepID=A0A9E6Y1M6_9ACTN|nr:ATP-binding protein [Capillimicrobium parvum]UGS38469.1 Sensor protein KdpD [Capillimicrobium parvum]